MENNLIVDKHLLLCIDCQIIDEDLLKNFCGIVFTDIEKFDEHIINPKTNIYICGDILKIFHTSINIINRPTYIITELSYNYGKIQIKTEISIGQVPLNMYNAGIYFKQFFDPNKDYFDNITKEHQFQILTESNKPDNALRKGIYLSKVVKEQLLAKPKVVEEQLLAKPKVLEAPLENDFGYRFNLLRCSTNLKGCTENFRDTDNEIISNVNNIVKDYFSEPVELNHVLAQIYENKKSDGKERKAKISTHSDKTKDMPRNGLIAFCTFYKDYNIKHVGDVLHKGQTIFTKLRFKLKKDIKDICPSFEITLYPNSVFVIPLSTNRLYTHEICSSVLPIDMIPVRCGYVIRASDQEAVHRYGITYIDDAKHGYVPIDKEPTEKDIKHLKDLYFLENVTTNVIDYGNIHFSLNNGDHLQPKL